MEIEPPEPDDLPEEDPMEGEGDDPDSDTVVALRAEQTELKSALEEQKARVRELRRLIGLGTLCHKMAMYSLIVLHFIFMLTANSNYAQNYANYFV